jgi:GT2 family glycosyltransferase
MPPESQPPAPAVVAVVVTCDPGTWFEQALVSLSEQDYPNLSVLIIDAGSLGDPTSVVAETFPGAFVRRLEKRVGFGTAANEVLSVVEGASHFLVCHDDVALEPDAVRLMVEEAFRSNAGIATPKFVQWDDPLRLLAVGASADKVGVVQDLIEPGELDQEQHDVVREVLVAPGGATLIRADLFAALGGFDEEIDQFGEDLDLSWRARIAGARITAVPAARVRHYQAVRRGERPGWSTRTARRRAARLTEAHRIRTLLTCYRWFDLLWIVPLAVAWGFGEVVTRLAQGRPDDAIDTVKAFAVGCGHPGKLWRSRRRVQRQRSVGDGEIRRLQARGNARFRGFVRSRLDDVRLGLPHSVAPGRLGRTGFEDPDDDYVVSPGEIRSDKTPAKSGAWRATSVVAAVLATIMIVGTRSLVGHSLPAIGQIPRTSGGLNSLWTSWWSGWQPAGLGVAAPSSPALGMLALIGTVLVGATGTLQHLVVLGPLVVGPLGAYRAAGWWGSRRGRIAALVAYAVVPLPYNALAKGHWGGLVAYAAAPWILSSIGRLSGEAPYPAATAARVRWRVVGIGFLAALVAAVAPSFLYVVVLMGLGLLVGSVLAARPTRGLRMAAISVSAAVVAMILLLPWSASVLRGKASTFGPPVGPQGRLGLGDVLTFHTGPFGGGLPGWALLVVAALPLFVGRGWRLAWAARLWVVALVSFAVAWAGSRGWIPAIPVEVALSPAVASLAGSAALGAAAFDFDLPGYRFGWRQLAAAVAGVALAVASLTFVVASGGGRWNLPSADAASVFAFLPNPQSGDYRVMWIGYPDALPLAGRELAPGVAYGTSFDGAPGPGDLWVSSNTGAAPQLASDLRLVENRLTTKVGHLLAPAGVRYLVIPNHDGPSGSGATAEPVPAALLAGLALQTDLQVLDVGDSNFAVYQNSAWAPVRSVLVTSASQEAAGAANSRRLIQQLDLTGAEPVLTGANPASSNGLVPVGSTVYVASTRSEGWRLDVEGRSIGATPGFGWGMSFHVPAPEVAGTSGVPTLVPAQLTFHVPFWTRAGQSFELLLWAVGLALLLIDLRRRRRAGAEREAVNPDWFTPMSTPAGRSKGLRSVEGPEVHDDRDDDDARIDV